jgi:hypothetical protein
MSPASLFRGGVAMAMHQLQQDALLRDVRQTYPYPIAHAALRLQAADDIDERFDEAFNLGKTLIITLGAVALAFCQTHYATPAGVRRWFDAFKRTAVSLGHWNGAARDGASLAREIGRPLSGMEHALGIEGSPLRAELDELVRLRNSDGADKGRDAARRGQMGTAEGVRAAPVRRRAAGRVPEPDEVRPGGLK